MQIILTNSHLKLRNLLLFVSISFDRLCLFFFLFITVQNPKIYMKLFTWNSMPVIEFFYQQVYLIRQEDLGELSVETKATSVDGQEFPRKDFSTLNAALVRLVWFYLNIIVCTNHYINELAKTFHTFIMIIVVEYELNSFTPLFCACITFHCRYIWLIFYYNITVYIENCSKTVVIYCNYIFYIKPQRHCYPTMF